MGKDKLYFLTFISILLVFLFGASIGINYSVKINVNLLLELELEAGKKEVQRFTYFLAQQSETDIDKTTLTDHLQEVLDVIEPGMSYIAVLDKENTIICHPRIAEIDRKSTISKRLNSAINQGFNLSSVHNILMDYKKTLHQNGEIDVLEVLYEKPIRNTDLKMVSIINLDKLLVKIIKLKIRLYTIFILMGVLIITISFFTVRFIGSFYEKKLEAKNVDLENDIVNITKLNLGVFAYQQRILIQERENERKHVTTNSEISDNQKKRLLSYKGDEIIPTATNNIAYIFTENSITYIVDKEDKKTVSKASLDEIYKDLDSTLFFRANRQFIIHIIAIEKIIKYGNSQLKIVILNSDITILIKKHRVSEFKRWLNI